MPSALEKFGKMIAQNCQGLPLAIVTVGCHLAKAEKTPKYWENVAGSGNSVIADTEEAKVMSKKLSLSYKRLPQHLKACFLYMGIFPKNHEIPASKLVKLWTAGGFLEPVEFKTLEDVAVECLRELVDRSLVLVSKQSSTFGIKTCTLHYVMWHVCSSKAEKHKFFHAINKYTDCVFPEDKNSQRRLSIRKNILFGIKDVYNSMVLFSTVRSLLCVGPHHPYPLRVCLGFKLLRVLDALTIRFYMFPSEILELYQLRYLALTYNGGELPAGMSKLRNLQFLIVRLHLSVKSSVAASYLPMEIWSMQELRHLQFLGSDLPDPFGALLPKLLTLLHVSAHSCTRGVLARIPNLRKLGIRIVLTQDAAAESLCPFNHFVQLQKLESLKCVVINPDLRSQAVVLPDSIAIFPYYLKKLALSGCGFLWEDMKKIGQLQFLEGLKLRCHAFRGPMWEVKEGEFRRLEFLLLEDMDLVHWRACGVVFGILRHLSIKHCYKLEELPPHLGRIFSLELIELVDCNPLAVASAWELEDKRPWWAKVYRLKVSSHFSWDDRKHLRPSQESSAIRL
ncbi:hypothetical protein Pfo_023953 [Paulownia fortunei]|nr:hypothetical protein Pfo_023953 [Paulownia fortunei]